MNRTRRSELSVQEFVLSPTCRYIGIAISAVSLIAIIAIPWPNYAPLVGKIKTAEKRYDSIALNTGPRELRYWVVIKYNVDGRDYETKRMLRTGNIIYNGSDIDIVYDRNNPGTAYIQVPSSNIHGLLFFIFLPASMGTGFLFWWDRFSRQRKMENQLANEEAKQKSIIAYSVPGHPHLSQVACPKCDVPIQYPGHLAGQVVRCSNCNYSIPLPAAALLQQDTPQHQLPPAPMSQPPMQTQGNPAGSFQDPLGHTNLSPEYPQQAAPIVPPMTEQEQRLNDLLDE